LLTDPSLLSYGSPLILSIEITDGSLISSYYLDLYSSYFSKISSFVATADSLLLVGYTSDFNSVVFPYDIGFLFGVD